MLDILTIGDIKLDAFITVPDATVTCRLDETNCEMAITYGKKIPTKTTITQVAGSAPNVAVGLSRMKRNAAVFSVMGHDITYKEAVDFLQQESVETKYIKSQKGAFSSFSAVLNYKGESTQLVSHGNADFTLPRRLPSSEWLQVSELGHGYQTMYKQLATLSNRKICFNPGAVQIEDNRKVLYDLIERCELLIVNRLEAHQLLHKSGNAKPKELLEPLRELGPNMVIITDGKKGAYGYDGQTMFFAPMFPGKRKEATGAGDAFMTGALGALLHGHDLGTALAWGSVNAAQVVQHIGPTDGLLTHTEIRKRLRSAKAYHIHTL